MEHDSHMHPEKGHEEACGCGDEKTSCCKDDKPRGSFLDTVPPRFAFLAGFISATALLSVIGLVIMLGVVLSGDTNDDNDAKPSVNTAAAVKAGANTNTNPSPTAAAKSEKIDMNGLRNIQGEGEITIVEFSDTECPFCKRFHETMLQVAENYDGKIRWAYKHFPLQQLHKKAPREAEATECAADQGKFWEYTDLLFATTSSNDSLPDEKLYEFADTLKIDRKKFDDCLASGEKKAIVDADASEAVSLGGTGTPFPLIVDKNGNVLEAIRGAVPYETLSAALDTYLK